MLANSLIDRSFKLELDVTENQCIVQVLGMPAGCYSWSIVDLNAYIISSGRMALSNQDTFSVRLDSIVPGQYILSISEEGKGTRHLKLVV